MRCFIEVNLKFWKPYSECGKVYWCNISISVAHIVIQVVVFIWNDFSFQSAMSSSFLPSLSPSPQQFSGSQSHICFLLKHNLQVCLVKCCSTIEKQILLFGFFKLYLLPCLWKEKELTIFDFKTIDWCLPANCSCWWGLGSYKGFEKSH